MTTIPAARPRQRFPEISAVSWEHPADRAALQSLRAVPGFDDVVRKVIGFLGGERGIRLLFQGNAVRAGAAQFPKLWTLQAEVAGTFDWPRVPELYVSQTPVFNAGAYGVDDPFIVVHSAALEMLDDDELRVLLAHEMGHVVSGHALYRTIAEILLSIGLSALPILAGIALFPIRLAILEWARKSELSADRAGLLCTRSLKTSMRAVMVTTLGSRRRFDELSGGEYLEQLAESNEPLARLGDLASHPQLPARLTALRAFSGTAYFRGAIGLEGGTTTHTCDAQIHGLL